MTRRLRTLALLARRPGLAVLEGALLGNERVELLAVATHRLLPRSESRERAERPEFRHFERLCAAAGVPLHAIDEPEEARTLPLLRSLAPVDLLCSVSWRFVIRPEALAQVRVAAVNLHRGSLPEYAGAEPVRRMIEDGLHEAVIVAHDMVEVVDAGRVLATIAHPITAPLDLPPADRAEIVKEELVPLYPRLLNDVLRKLAER